MNPHDAIAEIDELAGGRIVTELTGGPTSDSYLVECAAERFVLRIDNDIAVGLGLDRVGEARVLDHVSQKALGPFPVVADPDRGILVTQYVEGHPWSENDLRDSRRILQLAGLLKRLHGLEPIGEPFALHDKIERYARIVGTVEGRSIARAADQLLVGLEDPSSAKSLCHNDLTCLNMIDGDQLMLIDWEYAAVGDPMFDLALIAEHHHFESNAAGTLLRAYYGNVRGADVDRFNRYRKLYDCVQWLWTAAVETLGGAAKDLR